MNGTFTGLYATGETLRIEPVELHVEAGRLYLAGPSRSLDFSLADIRSSDRLGRVPRFLYLPNRGTVETGDHRAVDELVALQDRGQLSWLIHWLEARARVAATATVLVTLIAAAAVYFGLPVLAERAAYAVPASVEQQAGRAALATFNRYLAPSQLGAADRQRVQGLLDRLGRQQHVNRPLVIEFRSMGGKFPNAFALPGGIIVVSDELVKLAENDQELTAVLAHELGHVEHRHGLQTVLHNSAALLVVSTVTGDLSTVTSFAGSIPLTLLQSGYSREFEAQADEYALHALRTAGIDPAYFASILGKLQAARPGDAQDFSYLSTHPSTADRLRRINPDGHLPPKPKDQAGARPLKPKADTGSWVSVINDSSRFDLAGLPADQKQGSAPEAIPRIVSPNPVEQLAPKYPEPLRAKGTEGWVVVEYTVDETGRVLQPKVRKSSNTDFEAETLKSVAGWKFTPGQFQGRISRATLTTTVTFGLAANGTWSATSAVPPPPRLDTAFPHPNPTTSRAQNWKDLEVRPRALFQVTPTYPLELSAAKVEGKVTVEFVIDPDGNVRDVRVVRSSHKAFEAPAIAAVLQWKFAPGEIKGRKVATLASQIIEFNLDDPPAITAAPTK